MLSNRRIEVFRLLKDGKEMGIALSEMAARAMIPGHWAYEPDERADWTVTSQFEDLKVVEGTVVDFRDHEGRSYPHVFWDCPACGDRHSTDLDSDEANPALWYCERGRGMSLVQR